VAAAVEAEVEAMELVMTLARRPSHLVRCDCTRGGLLRILTGLPRREPAALVLRRRRLLLVRPWGWRVLSTAVMLPLSAAWALF